MERINTSKAISQFPESGTTEVTGAIFLTYTLNLGFFERIIQPALEKIGCQNILVLSDPDGYADAIKYGRKNVHFVGTRYVCSFIPRTTNYVQHTKLIFLIGPEFGKLLIGSGNLTLFGFSKNFEVFTQFVYNTKNPNPDSQYAFYSVNQFLKYLLDKDLSTKTSKNNSENDEDPIPEPERFIVPERDADGNFIIEDYTRIPYSRKRCGWQLYY